MVKKGDKTKPDPGSPLVLLIAGSAIRSVELVRYLEQICSVLFCWFFLINHVSFNSLPSHILQ